MHRTKTCQQGINWDPIIIFIICALPRICISFFMYPLANISDETSGMSVAAGLAGFDWKEIVQNAGYYGYGYLFVFAPLFRLVHDPIWIGRIIYLVSGLLEAAGSIICYKSINILYPELKRIKKVLISIVCGWVSILSTMYMHNLNEEPLVFCVWIMVFLIIRVIYAENRKEKIKKETFLAIVLAYMLTIHTRSVLVFITITITLVIYRIVWRKASLHLGFCLILVALYFGVQGITKLYQSSIWVGTARNASATAMTSGLFSLIKTEGFNLQIIAAYFRIIFGQLFTASSSTGGLFFFRRLCYHRTDIFKKREE